MQGLLAWINEIIDAVSSGGREVVDHPPFTVLLMDDAHARALEVRERGFFEWAKDTTLVTFSGDFG